MTVLDCVNACKGSLIKARRLYMKTRKWRDAEWYRNWAEIAHEWEQAARVVQK